VREREVRMPDGKSVIVSCMEFSVKIDFIHGLPEFKFREIEKTWDETVRETATKEQVL
jgi:hypothetical protein